MIALDGTRWSAEAADCWMLVAGLEPLIDESILARGVMRKILRGISRGRLGHPVVFETTPQELELVLELLFQSHTEEAVGAR